MNDRNDIGKRWSEFHDTSEPVFRNPSGKLGEVSVMLLTERRNPGRVRISALVAAVWMMLLLAVPPASAQYLPAPTLSGTWHVCKVTLNNTNEKLTIYNFQYRIKNETGWNNISGGASKRSLTLWGLPKGGGQTYQVRATALTVGSVVFSNASNSVTAILVSHSHPQCKALMNK